MERTVSRCPSFKKEELIKFAKGYQKSQIKYKMEMVHWTGQQEVSGDADTKCSTAVAG